MKKEAHEISSYLLRQLVNIDWGSIDDPSYRESREQLFTFVETIHRYLRNACN
jgi:hypothetical protein